MGVVLLTQGHLLHGSFVQLGDQLRCEQQEQRLALSQRSLKESPQVGVCSVLTTMHLSVQYSQSLQRVVVGGLQRGHLLC